MHALSLLLSLCYIALGDRVMSLAMYVATDSMTSETRSLDCSGLALSPDRLKAEACQGALAHALMIKMPMLEPHT